MAAHSRAESFGDLSSGRRRRAKKRDELVSARVRNQFSLTEVRANQVEDRAQHRLGIRLTKLVGEPSIVIDVRHEQGHRTTCRASLGNRCRGRIDEGVVRSEPSLLIEKNEMLLQAGALVAQGSSGFESGGKTTVRTKGRMTQGKSPDLCHIVFFGANFCPAVVSLTIELTEPSTSSR